MRLHLEYISIKMCKSVSGGAKQNVVSNEPSQNISWSTMGSYFKEKTARQNTVFLSQDCVGLHIVVGTNVELDIFCASLDSNRNVVLAYTETKNKTKKNQKNNQKDPTIYFCT